MMIATTDRARNAACRWKRADERAGVFMEASGEGAARAQATTAGADTSARAIHQLGQRGGLEG
jgi:hypothetical protein